jgi:hypothetical protein
MGTATAEPPSIVAEAKSRKSGAPSRVFIFFNRLQVKLPIIQSDGIKVCIFNSSISITI